MVRLNLLALGPPIKIYNSRNLMVRLNRTESGRTGTIYNSRNLMVRLNPPSPYVQVQAIYNSRNLMVRLNSRTGRRKSENLQQ